MERTNLVIGNKCDQILEVNLDLGRVECCITLGGEFISRAREAINWTHSASDVLSVGI